MNKKFLIFGLLAVVLVFTFTAVGCSSDTTKSPEQLIIDSYGDKEYTISFHSDGLDAPVPDISYAANNMPGLPTPERLGYIFEGWYLDQAYTKPYSEGILFLYMRDVTLYAKWSKEEFVQDGTYDIEYNANIVESSLREGELARVYGYKNLTEDIIANETYIEKSGNRLLLRLQYDCKTYESALHSELKSYGVTLAATLNDSNIYLYEKAESYTDTVKTLYIDITNVDITTPIYFNVSTTNWEEKGLTDDERALTQTTYTMSFTISRLIGFSRPYVDTSVPLDDGYYLVRTFFNQQDGSDTMLSSYNPIYSYIIAKDGNYTLVKPSLPYFGMIEISVGQLAEKYTANYFYRLATFMSFNVCYDVDPDAVNKNSSKKQEYYPSAYNAGYYREVTTEFHAATGRSYNVINIGNSVRKEFILSGSPTGFPEAAVNLGQVNSLLRIDYEHIIKLNSIDYEPLTGDGFQTEENIVYYPGALDDVSASGKIYDATEKYGLSTSLINYYFSTTGLNTSYESRNVYDSKITVTPSAAALSQSVSQSRYNLAEFTVSSLVYNYNPIEAANSGEHLYKDSMTLSAFSSANMREFSEARLGKTFTVGDRVSLAAVFAEKCNSTVDFKDVAYQAYKLKNGRPDFNTSVNIDSYFSLNEEVAVLFSWGKDGERRTSLVELAFESAPTVAVSGGEVNWNKSDFADNIYVADKTFSLDETVEFPSVTYNWGSVNGEFISDYYSSEMYPSEMGINPVTVCHYIVDNGAYTLKHINRNSLSFNITDTYELIVYELKNQYGERKYIYFECNSEKSSNNEYTVTDAEEGGNRYASGKIILDDYGDPSRIRVSVSDYLTKENAYELLNRTYYYHSSDVSVPFALNFCSVYTDAGVWSCNVNSVMSEDIISEIIDRAYGGGYAVIVLHYTRGDDTLTATYIANITFGGAKNYEAFTHEDWFTSYEYDFIRPTVYGVNGESIATASVSIRKYASASGTQLINDILARDSFSLTLSGKQYYLTFNQTGRYRIAYSFYCHIPNVNSITLYQDITVSDGKGNVSITYVTDAAHPFNDDIMQRAKEYVYTNGTKGYAYTVTYNLNENITVPNASAFASQTSDRVFGWAMTETNSASDSSNILAGNAVADFITKFNQKDVYLYCLWDSGLTVTTTGEGVESQSRRYYLTDDGYYTVRLGDFRAIAPSLHSFVGWTGGFLGVQITADTVKVAMPVGLTEQEMTEYCTITAEFREQLIAGYYINSAYSNSFFRNETVLDGYYVKSRPTAVGKDGYTFVGWFMATEVNASGQPTKIAEQAFNLKAQPITTDMTNTLTHTANGDYKTVKFVAVFMDAEGNLVW